MGMERVYGGIEAGGTKFVCIIGTGPDDLCAETVFPTTTPEETIRQVIDFFNGYSGAGSLSAIGIASFGPLNLDTNSPEYGHITRTPKPGWERTDILGIVKSALGLPVEIDTDVNGAALAEHLWGAGKGTNNLVYITIGTGIGGGGLVNGGLIHGLVHPEMGHICIPHDREKDPFEGCCPYHGDCLEGLASGKAVELRWGKPAEELPEDHPAWEMEAHYLALGISNIICTLSPGRIVTGGGLLKNPSLLPKVREKTREYLNGYIDSPGITEDIDNYIVIPGLGDYSGALGAIALARMSG
jgi:fructokinase